VCFDGCSKQIDARRHERPAWFEQSIARVEQTADARCLKSECVVDIRDDRVDALGQGDLSRRGADEADAIAKSACGCEQLAVADRVAGLDRVDAARTRRAREE
jgi:hypothetical protein